MPKLALYNRAGSQVGEIDLNENVFGVEVNEPVVHRAVVAHLAAMRAGTHKTKTRGEVSGGGKKPWRQKGTGRARQGSIRAPHWVGGGTVFGPIPRDYTKKINKKEKKLAVKSALTNKVEEGKLIVIDDFGIKEPKTKEMVKILSDLKLNDKKVLIILPGKDEAVYKSARNIPNVKTLVTQALNIYDLLNCEYIVMTRDAVAAVEEVLA
ncbi:50S ribosomal protein L4 [Anoxybacter fermentans]|uniref:Large ribosomal subunit protein uL4 n=1 Tax=Anoxybacter fermentans TaxID=1323375 RepID=A0A3Q9HSE8_9FIRM|nr:50S ribosomal protein L4 [Anoxybacter fermentans]AZR74719.1 50S ribosomal protein L4 [Anoxybacter fermentans]